MSRLGKLSIPVVILGSLAVYVFLIPTSMKVMKATAIDRLEDIVGEGGDTVLKLSGPLVDTTHQDFVRFQWYRALDWGDTARIHVDVGRYFSWSQELARVGWNHQWRYLIGPASAFENILPLNYKGRTEILSRLHLYPDQEKYYQNSQVDINPELLLFFLREGYFEILDRHAEHTDVMFYQAIGKVPIKTPSGVEMEKTWTAIIAVNDSAEVVIVPSDYVQRNFP